MMRLGLKRRIATLALTTTVGGLSCLAAAAPPPGDPAVGERLYIRCKGCHSPDRNRTGPLHCGLFGRVSGSVAGYAYSQAMREAGITWNAETLDRFLEAPLEAVPGTKMGFAGIKDASQRRDLIAYLATLTTDSPACHGVAAESPGEH